MNKQFLSRVSQIKEYVTNLKDSLITKDHQNASLIVSKFKNIILKQDAEIYAYQLILDNLMNKNEKLREELQIINSKKTDFQSMILRKKQRGKSIKEIHVEFVVTRLSVNLNEYKKLQLKEGIVHSDYNQIFINSLTNNRYKNYAINIKEIQNIQLRNNLLHVVWSKEKGRGDTSNLIMKFQNEKDAQRWSMCLKFGELMVKNKNESNIFQASTKEQEKQKQNNKLMSLMNNSMTSNMHQTNSNANLHQNIQNLQFNTGFMYKNSPDQSFISEKRSHEKNGQRSHEKDRDKDTQKSLVQELNQNKYSMMNPLNSRYGSRKDLKVPPQQSKLNKIRGLSDHLDNNFEVSRLYKNQRKQSQDIFKPQMNQNYHKNMLEKLKIRDRDDSIKSQANKMRTNSKSIQKIVQKSERLQSLQKKKKDMLTQIQSLTVQKPQKTNIFPFQSNKVNWDATHIQQVQQKSKSSGNRQSYVSFSVNDSGKDKERQQFDAKSQKISQKSLEESPRLPVNSSKNGYSIPKKVVYNDGTIFNLMQVQKNQDKDNESARNQSQSIKSIKVQQKNQINEVQEAQSKILSQSQDDSDEQSNPSTHENHTESQDNNGRAEQLKKGIVVTKCSENGFWPHEKILYLSENETELCSRDLKDKKIKKIKLSNIQKVQYNQYNKGIIKHYHESKIEKDKCLVIQALAEDNKIKNYEYVSNLAQPLKRFASNLKLFVEYYMKQ